jgi:hypothetical protein
LSYYPERDHGYPKLGTGGPEDVKGGPIVLGDGPPAPCPHCGCERLFHIEVELAPEATPPQLRVPEGSAVFSQYIGCPACPWASPAMTFARAKS